MSIGEQWEGALVQLPVYTNEGGLTRPQAAVWVSRESKQPVGIRIDYDLGPAALAETLAVAMARPRSGRPRSPGAVRVADEAQAEAVRQMLGGQAIEVTVGDTPWAELLVAELGLESSPRLSYVAHAEPGAAARLFEQAGRLVDADPWAVVGREDLVVLEADGWDPDRLVCRLVEEGTARYCLFGENLRSFDRFLSTDRESGRPPPDLGGRFWILELVAPETMPEPLAEEVAGHGWPLAADGSAPLLIPLDPDQVVRPVGADDIARVSDVASALATGVARHRDALARRSPPERDEVTGATGRPIRLSFRCHVPGQPSVFDVPTVDPAHPIDPALVAELGADELITALLVAHQAPPRGHPTVEDVEAHAMLHALVETHLMEDLDGIREALERLEAGGLDRHEATHAIGHLMMEAWTADPPNPSGIAPAFAQITADRWRDYAGKRHLDTRELRRMIDERAHGSEW